jgi:hypothetical protein
MLPGSYSSPGLFWRLSHSQQRKKKKQHDKRNLNVHHHWGFVGSSNVVLKARAQMRMSAVRMNAA